MSFYNPALTPLCRCREWSARLLYSMAALSLLMGLAACANAPRPVVEDGWEHNAGSSADARIEPAGADTTSRNAALDDTQTLVASSDNSMGAASAATPSAASSEGSAPDESHASNTATRARHALARPKIQPANDLKSPPGQNAPPEEVIAWLSGALLQNKSPDWMRKKLARTHAGAPENTPRVVIQPADFDGDQNTDLAVAIPAACGEDGCDMEGTWRVATVWADQSWSQLLETDARNIDFAGPADFTGDGVPDVGVVIETCGASTCFKGVRIFSTQLAAQDPVPFGKTVQSSQKSSKPALCELFDSTQAATNTRADTELSQDLEVLTDKNPARLALSGGTFGSAGAGAFQREHTTIWQWDAAQKEFTVEKTIWEKSNLRIDRLDDALRALNNGELDSAKKLLAQVIEDRKLAELPEALSGDARLARRMRQQLAQVARFELARIALAENDTDAFDKILAKMDASAPKSPATAATRQLGKVWRATANPEAACKTAVAEFPDTADDDWALDSTQLGYNAPVTFDAHGLCVGL